MAAGLQARAICTQPLSQNPAPPAVVEEAAAVARPAPASLSRSRRELESTRVMFKVSG